ncbi:hypothetical protein P167DRAFT_390304 [Morchella conica CCBAS932]|uniref:Uncharacterized protein n=1 Tax=Morchella conica CCBAS932 TaxID=1392247 RepID=A0A3N4KPT7_9PEZI|nr:hypothetical protein P167DRAFT_390304 [Morchella conica CCBAS932]
MKGLLHHFTTNFLFNICVGCLLYFFFQFLSGTTWSFSFFIFIFLLVLWARVMVFLSVGIIWIVCSFNLLYTGSYSLATKMNLFGLGFGLGVFFILIGEAGWRGRVF